MDSEPFCKPWLIYISRRQHQLLFRVRRIFIQKNKRKAKSNTYSQLAPWGTICLFSCQMPDSVYQLVINCVCLSGAVYSLLLKLFGRCMLGLKMMRLKQLIKLSCRLDNSTIGQGFIVVNKHFYAVVCKTDTLHCGCILVLPK